MQYLWESILLKNIVKKRKVVASTEVDSNYFEDLEENADEPNFLDCYFGNI